MGPTDGFIFELPVLWTDSNIFLGIQKIWIRGLLTCERRAASGERRAWIGEQGAVKLVCRVCLGCEIINKKSS